MKPFVAFNIALIVGIVAVPFLHDLEQAIACLFVAVMAIACFLTRPKRQNTQS